MFVFNPVVIVITYISNRLLLLVGVNVAKVKNPDQRSGLLPKKKT